MTSLSAFAVCAPGLEPLVSEELADLGLEVTGTERGGVALRTNLAGLYRANLGSRIATRILLRLATFRARTFPDLFEHTASLPWKSYLPAGTPVAVKAASRASRLYILKRIEAAAAEAIARRIGATPDDAVAPNALPLPPPGGRGKYPTPPKDMAPPPPGEGGGGSARDRADALPAQQVLVRLVNNQCTISLDTSGELLHRRGYRLATAKAPLRETLACAVLQLCGWNPETPLLDPFCGAGTFAIEAARWALCIPPGWERPFAFQSWPSFDERTWEALRDEAAAARRATVPAPIVASDRDPGAARMARDNAARAGVGDFLTFETGDFFDLCPEGPPGLVAINAPYGRRIGHDDLRALYRHVGEHLREHYRGWSYAMLCGNATLARATGLAPDHPLSLLHGGRHVPLVRGRL